MYVENNLYSVPKIWISWQNYFKKFHNSKYSDWQTSTFWHLCTNKTKEYLLFRIDVVALQKWGLSLMQHSWTISDKGFQMGRHKMSSGMKSGDLRCTSNGTNLLIYVWSHPKAVPGICALHSDINYDFLYPLSNLIDWCCRNKELH